MKLKFVLLILVFAALACTGDVTTLTLTPVASSTENPTAVVTPTNTSTPTNTPTATLPPRLPNLGLNVILNPDFSGPFTAEEFSEIQMVDHWRAVYCDEPYTLEKCPVPMPCAEGQTTGCNDPDLVQKRPEFKAIFGVNPYIGDNAQQWFCFYATCVAGIQQTFETTPGVLYNVGAVVRQWYNYDDDPESDIETLDDAISSYWNLCVDVSGGAFAFATQVVCSDDIYIPFDEWTEITYWFYSHSQYATLFIINTRVWPVGNNDSYVTYAYVEAVAFETPTPIVP